MNVVHRYFSPSHPRSSVYLFYSFHFIPLALSLFTLSFYRSHSLTLSFFNARSLSLPRAVAHEAFSKRIFTVRICKIPIISRCYYPTSIYFAHESYIPMSVWTFHIDTWKHSSIRMSNANILCTRMPVSCVMKSVMWKPMQISLFSVVTYRFAFGNWAAKTKTKNATKNTIPVTNASLAVIGLHLDFAVFLSFPITLLPLHNVHFSIFQRQFFSSNQFQFDSLTCKQCNIFVLSSDFSNTFKFKKNRVPINPSISLSISNRLSKRTTIKNTKIARVYIQEDRI